MSIFLNRYLVFLFVALMVAVTPLQLTAFANKNTITPAPYLNILIIHSYDKGNQWSQQQEEGFITTLGKLDRPVRLYYEFLSSKSYTSKAYYDKVKTLLIEKYSHLSIDYIYTTDDDATKFMMEERDSIFLPSPLTNQPIPIIFSGLNNNYLYPNHVFGVQEICDVKKTIQLIKEVHGDSTRILTVTDNTSTSQSIASLNQLEKISQTDPLFSFFMSDQVQLIKERLSKQDYDIVIFLLFNRDHQGNDYTYLDGFKLFRPHIRVPIYSSWSFYFGHGLVGGHLIDGRLQGQLAAEALIAHNLSPDNKHPNILAKNQPIFDYVALNDKRINISTLPKDSIIINNPVSYFQKHKEVLLWSFSIIVTLLFVILILYKLLQHKVNALVTAQNRVFELQKNETLFHLGVNLSHEMNTYIGNAISLSSLSSLEISQLMEKLESGQLSKIEATQGLQTASIVGEKVHDNLTRAVDVIEALKSDEFEINSRQFEKIKFHNLLNDVLINYQDTLNSKGIVIDIKISESHTFSCDYKDLQYILSELINNAIDHGFDDKAEYPPNPTIAIEIATHADSLNLKVCDNGKSIPTDIQPFIFDPFFCGTMGGNKGMGLFKVRKIAQIIYNGSANFEHHSKYETCFSVELKNQKISKT